MKKNIFKTAASSVNANSTLLTAASSACKIRTLLLAVIITAATFTSCATVKKLPGLEKIYVTNTKQINLLQPQFIQEPLDNIMQLDITFEENNFSVLTYIQADQNIIYMELMNDFMISIGTLEYDGNSIQFDCPLFPPTLKPEYIINDFQNAYYSAEALNKNLNASRLTFEEAVSSDGTITRSIKDKSKLIEEITVTPESVTIKNYLRSYEYTLFSAE